MRFVKSSLKRISFLSVNENRGYHSWTVLLTWWIHDKPYIFGVIFSLFLVYLPSIASMFPKSLRRQSKGRNSVKLATCSLMSLAKYGKTDMTQAGLQSRSHIICTLTLLRPKMNYKATFRDGIQTPNALDQSYNLNSFPQNCFPVKSYFSCFSVILSFNSTK